MAARLHHLVQRVGPQLQVLEPALNVGAAPTLGREVLLVQSVALASLQLLAAVLVLPVAMAPIRRVAPKCALHGVHVQLAWVSPLQARV